MHTLLSTALGVALAAGPVSAEPPAAESRAPAASPALPVADLLAIAAAEPARDGDDDIDPGILPALVAVVPGLALHGAGHLAAGDTDTALKLLGLQGIGIGMIMVGGVPLAATGASRKIIGPTTAVSLMGVGLLFTPVLPDIYGALTGGRDAPPPPLAPLSARLGYAWVYDPQFAYRNFATVGYAARFEHLSLVGDAWLAADDDNQRLRQRLDWRWIGDNVGRRATGGSLDLQTAVTWHRYGTEGFSRLTTEVAFDGVYDMGHMARSLRGSFALGALGYALEFYDYDVPGLGFGEDVAEQLLARFGWGFWFADRAGSLAVYYDHRKDDHTGGFSSTGLGGGIPGYIGLLADYAIDDDWTIDLDVRRGSAIIVGLGATYRYGE